MEVSVDTLKEFTVPEEFEDQEGQVDHSQEEDKLSIDEESAAEEKSDAEDSEAEVEEDSLSVDNLENEIRALNRHLFGILENTVSYQKDIPWSKYVENAELTLKLNLKILIKTYYLNQGQLEKCSEITLTSNLDVKDPRVVELLAGINNPTGNQGKIAALEKNMILLNGQILRNSNLIANASKDKSAKPILNAIQLAQLKMVKDIDVLKESLQGNNNYVTIKDVQDIVEELTVTMEAKCSQRSKNTSDNYPTGHDFSLDKIVKKNSDLAIDDIKICIKASITFSDPIVATVILDILGIDMDNPNTGKLMSDFAKNLASPLSAVQPEARMRQKTQFARVVNSWEVLLNNIVNPGMISASSVIEEARIAFYALKDICAERLPIGVKIKSLGMLFMAGIQNQPKNDHVLQKIFELRPQLPSKLAFSFEQWPKNRFNWSNGMKNWSKENVPLGKPFQFVDINLTQDNLTTLACQKDFGYNSYLGNNKKTQKLNTRKSETKPKVNPTGHSGLSVWDICQRNANKKNNY